MEVTEEMRAAVLTAECDRRGHVPNIDEAISNDPSVHPDETTIAIRATNADTMPHLSCQRCGRVWLIVESAPDYDTAEAALNERLAPKHQRKLRKQHRREARAAADAAAVVRPPAPVVVEPAPLSVAAVAAPDLAETGRRP